MSGAGEEAVTPKVGIRDVARAAGVSVTTVSHVLNETPHTRTSEATRDRVRSVARELGYTPNRLARGLRTRASDMIGLLTEEIATTPHAGRIILGAQEDARRHNLPLAIINSHLDAGADARRADARALIERQVDGIIYATVFHHEVSVPRELRAVPAVLIGALDRQGVVPAVLPDEASGAADLVALLAEAGHRRIAFADSSIEVPATQGRLVGYLRGLEQARIPRDDRLITSGVSEAGGGYTTSLELLDRADRPTAIFCYNDRMAMGAYRAAQARPASSRRRVDRRLRRPGPHRGQRPPGPHHRRPAALRDGRVGGGHLDPAHPEQQHLVVPLNPPHLPTLPSRHPRLGRPEQPLTAVRQTPSPPNAAAGRAPRGGRAARAALEPWGGSPRGRRRQA
jgi:LacI family transcriptional regulator